MSATEVVQQKVRTAGILDHFDAVKLGLTATPEEMKMPIVMITLVILCMNIL